MRKDKEWLKEKVREIARRVGDEHLYINIDTMLKLINQLDEPEKPVVPEYMADFIKHRKGTDTYSFRYVMRVLVERDENKAIKREYDWIDANTELFAQAWLAYPNIEVEKEPLYYVVKDGVVILSKRYRDYDSHESHWIGTVTNKEYIKENPDKVRFTEQEIKDYDERFWSFAVPVEELEE